MLVGTTDEHTRALAARLLEEHIFVKPSHDFQALMWVNPESNKIEWIVGYTNFLGKTCQMHVLRLTEKLYSPKKMLWASFDYPFNRLGLEIVFGVLNGNNKAAIRYDKHLGFKEVNRFEGVHDDGGDIILMAMKKEDCRWIREARA